MYAKTNELRPMKTAAASTTDDNQAPPPHDQHPSTKRGVMIQNAHSPWVGLGIYIRTPDSVATTYDMKGALRPPPLRDVAKPASPSAARGHSKPRSKASEAGIITNVDG
jgi:hypothetical protein